MDLPYFSHLIWTSGFGGVRSRKEEILETKCVLLKAMPWRLAGILLVFPWCGARAAYVQEPDVDGWAIPSYAKPLSLCDDWVSPFTGPITSLDFWLAWAGDQQGVYLQGELSISADQDLGGGIHVPGQLLWSGQTQNDALAGAVDQGWFRPDQSSWGGPPGEMAVHDHTQLHKTWITDLTQPLNVQQGVTYWIAMYVWTDYGVLGWSTSTSQSGMPATYYDPFEGWKRLNDPLTGAPLDLAFEVVPEPAALVLLALGGLAAMRRPGRRHAGTIIPAIVSAFRSWRS